MSYDAEAKGARCSECVLAKMRVGGPVGPEYHDEAVAAVVAETPGEKECRVGRPLVGSSGMEFTDTLNAIGISRMQVDLHLAIACQPPENDLDKVLHRWKREDKKREKNGEDRIPSPIECCRPRLLNELRRTDLITLGKVSYEAVTNTTKPVLDIRGGPVDAAFDANDNFVMNPSPETLAKGVPLRVLPTLHPGFVQRTRRWTRAFRSDLSRAFRWFEGRLLWKEPRITLNPTPDQLVSWLQRNRSQPIVFDVETTFDDPTEAKLKCVGLSTEDDSMVVHLLSIEGPDGELVATPYYTAADEADIRAVLREFFINDDFLKVGHNAGYFDTIVIKQHFGVTPAPLIDTILVHRAVESELPHRLGYVGSVYTDVTAWKDAHTAAEASTDEELGVYCVFHGTMVQLADGKAMTIHDIVEKKLPVIVQSRDPETSRIVQKPVIGWFKNTVPGQAWKNIRLAATTANARGLIATPEHEIHTRRGRVRAEDVRVGDAVFINEREFSPEQTSAIIGTLLGSSILAPCAMESKNRFHAPRASLRGGHITASGLAQYKAQRLAGFIRLGKEHPERNVTIQGRKSVTKPFTPFNSSMLHQLAALQRLIMDEDGTRRLLIEALYRAGPIGLAWWFMDDGSLRKSGAFFTSDTCVISAKRYPPADIKAAKAWLEKRFGRIYLGADKLLQFTPDAARAFGEYIAPHLPPSARHKLPRDHDFPDYDPQEWPTSSDFATSLVVNVSDYSPPRDDETRRIRAETRYCLEVEGTHNFMTADGLVQNCGIDCVVTARALPKLAEASKLRGQDHIVAYDHQIQQVCVGLHENGMFLDRARRNEEQKRLVEKMSEWRRKTCEASGKRDMNPNSTVQVRTLLFDEWSLAPSEYTKLGDPSTSDAALRLLRTQNRDKESVVGFIDALRRYRTFSKEYGTYVRRMVPYGTPLDGNRFQNDEEEEDAERGLILRDGRIRPDYNAHGTTSGRLSSSNPNAQNFPKHLRGMVMAQPGCVLIGADADQLELRIIASVARMDRYLEVFAEGGDPHALTASLMFGKNFDNAEAGGDQWTKLRNLAKGIKYASFYGSGDETVHGIVTSAEDKDGNLLYPNLTVREVATIRRNWLKGIPQLPRWWEDTMEQYRSTGYILDPVWGRRRDFLDGEAFNEIVNFPIQSAGAHIIHESTFDLLRDIPFGKWGPGTGLVCQVHDALYVEAPCPHPQYEVEKLPNGKPNEKLREFGWCPPGCKCEANWAARRIEAAMNRDVPGLDGVTFKAKAKIGLRWSDV